jgi:hypothetical protein
MSLIRPIAYFQQKRVSVAPPAVAQNIYLCGFNFYKWNGTQLGSTTQGGIAKIDLTGSLDTTWITNANPVNTTQVRYFAPLNGNIYADYRIPNSSTRSFRKLDSTGTSVANVTTTGGSIFGVSAREGNDFIVVTGDTTISYGGTTIDGVGKIMEDLTLNSTFVTNIGTGPNAFVISSHVSVDRIAVSGLFTNWNGNSSYDRFVVLNYDGTRDTGFSRPAGNFNGSVNVGIFIDNKWIVGGAFTTYSGVTRNRIIAFNTDGSIDTTFTTNSGTGFNGTVNAIFKVSDTQVVVTGAFTTLNGVTQNRVALLNTDGTIPTQPFGTGFNNVGGGIAIDNTGKYYFVGGGNLTTYQGVYSSNNFFPVNTDGSINSSFVTGSAMQTSTNAISEAGAIFIT